MTKKNTAVLANITEIKEIDGVEELELAVVNNNYQVAVPKNSVSVGDKKVFVPAGSWIPSDIVTMTDSGKYKDIDGGYLNIKRIQNNWSEGILLELGATDGHNIREWQRELPEEFEPNKDNCKTFPKFLKYPELENCHDLGGDLFNSKDTFEVTPLLDGISMISYVKDGRFGICSNNYEIQSYTNSNFWKVAKDFNLPNMMSDNLENCAFYGTIVGPKIYTNVDKFSNYKYFIHDIFDIKNKTFLSAEDRYNAFVKLAEFSDFEHVPVFERGKLSNFAENMQELLEYADGTSMNPYSKRKGLVFKSKENPNIRFKVKSRIFDFSNKL